jgi:hypothetical protein
MKEVVIDGKTYQMMPELPKAKTTPPWRENLCRGCFFWDGSCKAGGLIGKLQDEEVCGNSRIIYIETTEEAMAQYVAARLES